QLRADPRELFQEWLEARGVAARAPEPARRDRAPAYRVPERDGHSAGREQHTHRHPAQRDAADRHAADADQADAQAAKREAAERDPAERQDADGDVAERDDPASDPRPSGLLVDAARDVDERQAEDRDARLVLVAPAET